MRHGITYGAGKYQGSVFAFTFATNELGATIGRHVPLRYEQSRPHWLEPITLLFNHKTPVIQYSSQDATQIVR